MAVSSFFCDSSPHSRTASTTMPSNLAKMAGSTTSALRNTIVVTSDTGTRPAANSRPSRGNRSRNANPRVICPEARPELMLSAHPISAAAASQSSQAQPARSGARRRSQNSTIAASFTASARAAAAPHPVTMSTRSASPAAASDAIGGTAESYIRSILARPQHLGRRKTAPVDNRPRDDEAVDNGLSQRPDVLRPDRA
ncbi:hypothetical protein MCHUDSM44219_04227 [Mycolicibacterium chubuense]|uniref:Uncharacterized protein n=1 Tax=Mycolicibacterium chubuense TaxID=1800 RepID=A0A0J6VRI0_MYCCU|nr:hypothetical protein MCHUDSM44219_04227 [Mycolicibacterium chubuense]